MNSDWLKSFPSVMVTESCLAQSGTFVQGSSGTRLKDPTHKGRTAFNLAVAGHACRCAPWLTSKVAIRK